MSEKVNEFVGALLGKSESEGKRVKEPLAMLLRSGKLDDVATCVQWEVASKSCHAARVTHAGGKKPCGLRLSFFCFFSSLRASL